MLAPCWGIPNVTWWFWWLHLRGWCPGGRGGREIFFRNTWKVRYTNQIRTRYRNWRTTSATQLQPSESLCYIGCTSTWWQHDCWLSVQTLYAIYILTPERISQGHVQNGRRATFSWPTLYNSTIGLYDSDSDVSHLGQFTLWVLSITQCLKKNFTHILIQTLDHWQRPKSDTIQI